MIKTLIENSYERVILNDENELKSNFKAQLEKHNTEELKRHGRTSFTESEFDKILLYLEGGTCFEKAKKLRDLKEFELENGSVSGLISSIPRIGARTSFRWRTR